MNSKNNPFDRLTPFEKTVLQELAKCSAFASAAFQLASVLPDDKPPSPKEILQKAHNDSMIGLLETLRKNQKGL